MGEGLQKKTFLISHFVGQMSLMNYMSDGRNLEPWSQKMSKIEIMVKFEFIDELSR